MDGGIEPVPRLSHGVGVDIRGEDLKLDVLARVGDRLAEQDGEGIGFLACAASGDPDPQRLTRRLIGDQTGNDVFGEKVERFRVAKELGDVDEQILGQKVELTGSSRRICR